MGILRVTVDCNEQGIPLILEKHLKQGEELLAWVDVTLPPYTGMRWVPVVGGLIELGRVAAMRCFFLTLTSQRLILLERNKAARLTGLQEIGIQSYNICDIASMKAGKAFMLDARSGDSLEIVTTDGNTYKFRGLDYSDAVDLCDTVTELKKRS